jgi:hypothetical protein
MTKMYTMRFILNMSQSHRQPNPCSMVGRLICYVTKMKITSIYYINFYFTIQQFYTNQYYYYSHFLQLRFDLDSVNNIRVRMCETKTLLQL